MDLSLTGYKYRSPQLNCSHDYLIPALKTILCSMPNAKRVFDLGCGNGSVANLIHSWGFEVTGVDPSAEGLEQAKNQYPHLKLFHGSAYDDLAKMYGRFPVVLSLEVVEHLYFPRKFAATIYDLTEGGGISIISTPYHGYLKNVVMALGSKMDQHFTALWDHGHIKFWSMKTLGLLLKEAGFRDVSFIRVGRVPALAKSMIAVAKK